MSAPRLSVRDLAIDRGGRRLAQLDVLDVQSGEIVALIGRNGAGKSTLLRSIAGIEPPTLGTVLLDGVPLARPGRVDATQRRSITLALPQPWLFRGSVRANLHRAVAAHGVARADRGRRVDAIARELELADLLDAHARALSSGETARVSLARALVLATPVLLLDEPTAHLDPEVIPTAAAAIARRSNAGSAVVLAGLDPAELAGLPTRVVRVTAPEPRR